MRPLSRSSCFAFGRGCDVERGVMRPRFTTGSLVDFLLGRRHVGSATQGCVGHPAPPNLPGLLSAARCAGFNDCDLCVTTSWARRATLAGRMRIPLQSVRISRLWLIKL
jgi:hypothetical protein